MTKIQFKALDYTADDSFIESEYEFSGDEATGWKISRNGESYLDLDPGYRLLKTRACGVCSTDLDRRFLPFPLPQIIGHEVIAEDTNTKETFVVEINDTLEARGSNSKDEFILAGIPTHSPERKVLGIDRLPGGFGPYILAPKNAAIPYTGIPDKAAVLIEPFAASLQAVIASPPEDGDEVAVLGPRRLGSLVIAALVAYRLDSGKNFKIFALARRKKLLDLAIQLGVDEGIDISSKEEVLKNQSRFAIVYDTTSTPEGFLSALNLAKREVHLKTTNGQKMGGINHLTELVVDELSILPFTKENLFFHWENESRDNKEIYISPSINEGENYKELENLITDELGSDVRIHTSNPKEAIAHLQSKAFADKLPRFDLAIVSTVSEIEQAIRPVQNQEESLVRPRGAILVIPELAIQEATESGANESEPSALVAFLEKGGSIRSSRCGDFHLAIKLLQENPSVAQSLADHMVSHQYGVDQLPEAFVTAKSPDAIKVVVNHG